MSIAVNKLQAPPRVLESFAVVARLGKRQARVANFRQLREGRSRRGFLDENLDVAAFAIWFDAELQSVLNEGLQSQAWDVDPLGVNIAGDGVLQSALKSNGLQGKIIFDNCDLVIEWNDNPVRLGKEQATRGIYHEVSYRYCPSHQHSSAQEGVS